MASTSAGDDALAKQNGQRRLLRSDLTQPGIRRLRCGRGFRYLTPEGQRPDDAIIARIRTLAIPPAWQQVWICTSPGGHIQAVGRDSAGRRQEFTVKDFRTWHGTVLAAVGLAVSECAPTSPHALRRAVARVIKEVAEYLGNTPAVARGSYIDPRVVDNYQDGTTIARVLAQLGHDHEFGELATVGDAEAAVLRMLLDSS